MNSVENVRIAASPPLAIHQSWNEIHIRNDKQLVRQINMTFGILAKIRY